MEGRKKVVLSGNQAVARGAYEAGCTFASAYPGTPSTEILETIADEYRDSIYAEWSINEKVALESAVGSSYAGARSLVTMKHVGLNVAADPLMTLPYTGVVGGLVIITADDPHMHSSQNEQDNRHYARFAKVPMLEPSDSHEAKEFTKLAFFLSEKYDTPVLVRTTTRISHGFSVVELDEPVEYEKELRTRKENAEKWTMLPSNARKRHPVVERRLEELKELAENIEINRIEWRDREIGFITGGISYVHTKEVFPHASFLKLGMSYPLPEKMIREFAEGVKKLYVVEELDPFWEEQIRAMGIEVIGKEIFPRCGELDPDIIYRAVMHGDVPPCGTIELQRSPKLPVRPPILCPGCPHRSMFYQLNKKKYFVTGDIGCYTLGYYPPLSAMHTTLDMGASLGHGHGMFKVLPEEERKKVVSVIGDSTFMHSGITHLLNMAYNKTKGTIIILDNRTTAMTGQQVNPTSGVTLMGEETYEIDFKDLARSFGVQHILETDAWDMDQVSRALDEAENYDGLSLIIHKGPCALIPDYKKNYQKPPMLVDLDKCSGCKICLNVNCPSLSWVDEEGFWFDKKGNKRKRPGYVIIDELSCTGCDVCAQSCPFDAIIPGKEE